MYPPLTGSRRKFLGTCRPLTIKGYEVYVQKYTKVDKFIEATVEGKP
jgi:hypothetical protein